MLRMQCSLSEIVKLPQMPDGSVEPEACLNRFWARYEQVEPVIQAFVPEDHIRNRLNEDMRRLQLDLAGSTTKPPLYGVPVGIKDLLHVNGLATRAGSQLPPEVLTGNEGYLVSRLRSLGALVAGKTVTEEFAYAGPMPTRNPWHTGHTPGGSSAGSAAAVAAGLCPLAVGTQTLRSVTAPASFCGVVGYKPSYGRVPLDGTILLSPSMDTAGLLTQDVESMIYAAAWLVPEWRALIHPGRKPVLGIPKGIYMEFMSSEVRGTFVEQLEQLKRKGYEVRPVNMPWEDAFLASDALLRLVEGEMAQVHAPWFDHYEDIYYPLVKQAILRGRGVDTLELEQYRLQQLSLRERLSVCRQEAGVDLWVSPAQGGIAPKIGERTGWPGMTAIWTFAGCPTVTVPSALLDGLPLGFQCVGNYGEDEELLSWSRMIAKDLQQL